MINKKIPNLFIVGAAKCGTTALADFLGQHPEIYIAPIKEPYYFISNPEITSESEYLKLFSSVAKEKLVGEATTGYLFDPVSPKLIKEFNPNANIIIILRNPIDMAYSLWKYMSVNGNEKLGFLPAIEKASERKSDDFVKQCAGRSENYLYIERARYFDQVKRYIDEFGVSKVKILIFEEFIQNPVAVCQGIFEDYDLDRHFRPHVRVINSGGGVRSTFIKALRNRKYPLLKKIFSFSVRKRIRGFIRDINVKGGAGEKITPHERMVLKNMLSLDVAQLEKLIGRPIKEWEDFNEN